MSENTSINTLRTFDIGNDKKVSTEEGIIKNDIQIYFNTLRNISEAEKERHAQAILRILEQKQKAESVIRREVGEKLIDLRKSLPAHQIL
jgi:hypothetical protein